MFIFLYVCASLGQNNSSLQKSVELHPFTVEWKMNHLKSSFLGNNENLKKTFALSMFVRGSQKHHLEFRLSTHFRVVGFFVPVRLYIVQSA